MAASEANAVAADADCEFYLNSKGQRVPIKEMLYPHLLNARDKLVRDQQDGERQDEIDAMSARIKVMDAAHAEAEAAKVEPVLSADDLGEF